GVWGWADVPTTGEAGVDFIFSAWNAMVAPKGTPKDIVAMLADALSKALDDPAIQKRYVELGSSAPKSAERGPAALQKLVESEVARITPEIKAGGVTAESQESGECVAATIGAIRCCTLRARLGNSDEWPLAGRIDFHPCAVRDRLRDVEIEAGDHGKVGERRALHHDRVDGVQDQRRRHDAARFHLVQHPRGGDAALGGIEHEHAADISLAGELVVGTRKYAAHAIEIVARGEAVFRDQRLPAGLWPHAGRREENLAAHDTDRCRRSIHS